MEKTLLILILTLGCCLAASSDSYNVTGTVDEGGQCLCTMIMPDNTFPMYRMESLETASHNLTISVQREITKIQSYQSSLAVYMERLSNLTRRVENVELGIVSYRELDFTLMKLEIQEMETLAVQLRASFNGSNTIVETLFMEIQNISVMVNQLESYDKNNVLAVRREIASLRKRLQDCEKNQTVFNPPPVIYGTCNHGGLINVTKPFVVQLNWRGFSYMNGGWGKDSFVEASNKNRFWVAPLNTDARLMELVRLYPAYDDLLLYKNPSDKTLSKYNSYSMTYDYSRCGQGSGMTLYNNSLYYNCYNSQQMCRMDLDTNNVQLQILPDAVYNNRFSYAAVSYQDMDFAADEQGLWVLYSTEQNAGNIVIGKLNVTSFTLERTWATTQYKPGVTNAFMICGVLYATRPVNTRMEEIFYMYDTNTGKEGKLSIMMDKMMETVQNLQYNANDHKLYMFNYGYLVTYEVTFRPESQ